MTDDDTPRCLYICHNRNGHPEFEVVTKDDIGAVPWVPEGSMTVLMAASEALGGWMSAALEDPKVCAEMKADINAWFAALEPMEPKDE